MLVCDALMERRLFGDKIDGRLPRQNQPVHPGCDVDDARNVLLRVDDVARGLCKANEPDVNHASRHALNLAGSELLDDHIARKGGWIGRGR